MRDGKNMNYNDTWAEIKTLNRNNKALMKDLN